MSYQTEPPVVVYNGIDAPYRVASVNAVDGSAIQLVGIADQLGDAFGRLRVSDPVTLFEASFTYDLQPTAFESLVASSGTVAHDTDARAALMTVTGTSGSRAVLQSRKYLPYFKGKSQLVKVTGLFGAAVENVRRRAGYFDDVNGFFLEQDAEALAFVRRSSSSGELVDTHVPQAEWNRDRLDGTGPSGITLDLSKGQIVVIDGQWLGVGRVRMGFNIGGATIYCHEFLHANVETVAPYTQTFSLPVRWEVESTGASAGATLLAVCAEVESEGGTAEGTGLSFSAANAADVNTSTSRAHVLSIRPAAQYPASSGLVNRTLIVPIDVSVLASGASILVEVFHASTLTGGAWAAADTNSAVEVGTGQTITTPGIRSGSFFVAAAANVRSSETLDVASTYPLTLDISGANPRAMTIAATTLTGTGTVRSAVTWREIR